MPGESECWLAEVRAFGSPIDGADPAPVPMLDTCSDDIDGADPGPDPVDNYVRIDAERILSDSRLLLGPTYKATLFSLSQMNYISGRCYELYGRFTYMQVQRMVSQYEMYRAGRGDSDIDTDAINGTPGLTESIESVEGDKSEEKLCRLEGFACIDWSDCCSGMTCARDAAMVKNIRVRSGGTCQPGG